jgi:hypothetical protein
LTPGLDDKGHLAFPERSLVNAIDAIAAEVPVIAAGHHPLECFNDAHCRLLQQLLTKRAIAYFCGHLHESSPKTVSTPNGTLFVAQTGALYNHRDYWNGYAIVAADPAERHFRTTLRRWFEPRREFSFAEDIADRGVFYSSDAAEAAWHQRGQQVDRRALAEWRKAQLLPALFQECNEGLSSQSLEEVFVAPEFERDVIYQRETDERVGSRIEPVSLEQILLDRANYLISAPKESGKSTLLKQIALRIAKRSDEDAHGGNIPVLLNFGNFKAYKAQLENLARQKLPQLPSRTTVPKLLADGLLTILIDDVEFQSADRKSSMVKFIEAYPKNRYILTTSTAFVESAAMRPEISPNVPFIQVRMRPLRQKHVLALIENHGTRDPLKADRLLERLTRDASALNMPLTAVTTTFLIQIIISEPKEGPIHQAALIERYLEILLEKFAPRELLPGTFNFRNKVDLLSAVAERMVREELYEPSPNILLGWIINYLKVYGLNYSASDILKYFLDSRILTTDGGLVRFRLRVFLEFFVAVRMREDEQFRTFIFDSSNYLRFPNEISFYAALSLRDKEHLEKIFDEFVRLSHEIWSDDQTPESVARYIENYKEPHPETSQEELLELQRQVRSEEEIMADRRAILEEGGSLPDDAPQGVFRPTISSPEDRWMSHLVLLSGMLKHMELIPDWDKRRFLTALLDGWLQFVTLSLSLVGVLAKEKKVVLNGVTYRTALPDDLPVGEIARRLALFMPSGGARMATVFLGTEKLQLQLESGIGEESEPVSRQFMRFAILSNLMAGDIGELAKKLSAQLTGHRYLRHVFARKLYDIAVRFRLPEPDYSKVRLLVGDLFVALGGVPQKEALGRKNRVLNALERQRLLIELKRDRES